MYKERTKDDLLIPNVPVEISTPAKLVVLVVGVGGFLSGGDYEFPGNTEAQRAESRRTEKRLRMRNWRSLRGELIDLDTSDRQRVSGWLSRLGFAPNHGSDEWQPEFVTDQLVALLEKHRQVAAWLMGLDVESFRSAVRTAHEYFEERRDLFGALINQRFDNMEIVQMGSSRIGIHVRKFEPKRFRDPAAVFRTVKAPANLDPWILSQYLMGTGTAPSLTGWFLWDRTGSPKVSVLVPTPMEAIALSIHIDRNFSVRQWTSCENLKCRKGYERARGDGRFCSSTCKNYVLTSVRREKIRRVKEADGAWRRLKETERKRHDQWEWIADFVMRESSGDIVVKPTWVRKLIDGEIS